MQVIRREGQLRFGIRQRGPRARHRCFGCLDPGDGGLHSGSRAVHRGARGFHGAALRGNPALRVDDLLFESLLIGQRLLQRVFIRTRIDREKQIAFSGEAVVFDGELNEAPIDLRRDFDEVRAHVGVVGAGIPVRLLNDEHEHHDGRNEDSGPDEAADPFARRYFQLTVPFEISYRK